MPQNITGYFREHSNGCKENIEVNLSVHKIFFFVSGILLRTLSVITYLIFAKIITTIFPILQMKKLMH